MDLNTVLQIFALPVGIVASLIGALAVIKPKFMSEGFGIEVKGDKALSYVVALGIRDVFVGLTVLTLYFQQQWTSIGYISLFIALVAVSDFIVVFKNGHKQTSYIHLAGVIISLIYGLLILSTF